MNHQRSRLFLRFKKAIRRLLALILLTLCGSYLGICLMLFFIQKTLIYAPDVSPVAVNDSGFPSERIQEVKLKVADDIELFGWHVTVKTVPAKEPVPRRLVLICPGNGGNRLNRVGWMELYHELGYDALIVDYRGYGGSAGAPSEKAIAADFHQVWQYAIEELDYSASEILVLGQSLGGGVATRLVAELCESGVEPAGLVLQATFTQLADAGKHRFPWLPVHWLIAERYTSIDRIDKVTCPILVIHGQQDQIVPHHLGKQLFEAAPERSSSGVEKVFLDLPESGHNNMLYTALDPIRAAIVDFQMRAEESR